MSRDEDCQTLFGRWPSGTAPWRAPQHCYEKVDLAGLNKKTRCLLCIPATQDMSNASDRISEKAEDWSQYRHQVDPYNEIVHAHASPGQSGLQNVLLLREQGKILVGTST